MFSAFREKMKHPMKHPMIPSALALGVFFLAGLCIHGPAWPQEEPYPNKPMKIIIPYEPGGLIDLVVRVMTDLMAQELKVPMVIENRGGAGGMLGASMVLKAKPDGYTLLASSDTAIDITPLVAPNPPYDPFNDFSPICSYGVTAHAFGAHASSPFKDISDLVKYARQNPGKITCGVVTVGSSGHFAFELFKKGAGVDIKLVPYKGTGEAVAGLLGKHIDMLVLTNVAFSPYIKSKEAKILAVSDPIPGSSIPSLVESGYSQTAMGVHNAFFVSSKTPKPILEKLVPAFERIVKNPELGKKWEAMGFVPLYKNPAEFTALCKERWQIVSKLVDELGLKGK